MTVANSAIAILALIGAVSVVYSVVWRLYFSPLANFPGPKIGAATLLYEMYYEIVAGGQYTFKIRDMHEKYGPIVRINPWELHINDPDFYDQVYTGGSKKSDKWPYLCGQFGTSDAALSTVSHNLHRLRRAPMNKMFSEVSINKLEPLIHSTIDGLIARLRGLQESKTIVPISLAWTCVTMDIISDYSFGKSYDYVQKQKLFRTDVHAAMESVSKSGVIVKKVPWIMPIMRKVPLSMMRILFPRIVDLLIFQNDIQAKCESAINDQKIEKETSRRTIFHELLSSDMPPEEKRCDRIMQEGIVLIAAGTETTAWALSVIAYYVLANPDINANLKAELMGISSKCGGTPNLTQLEQLPYLSAVISEGLRLSFGVTAHLQRVSPDQNLVYRDWIIPAGTPVSMSSLLLHHNPKTFPEPSTFRPERWIENLRLSRYLVSFSKGSRQCLGINLAYAELYLCVYKVWMAFPDMKLIDTTKEDVEVVADYFIPVASGRGVKAMMG